MKISALKVSMIAISILTSFTIIGCMHKTKSYNLSEVTGILIFGGWESYIYAYTNEKIFIQIPIYDFSNELEDYSVAINNFNIGEVEFMKMAPQNKFPDFEQYTLQFFLIPKKTGIHTLDDLTIVIQAGGKNYEENLGRWIFEVNEAKPDDNLDITGGSLFNPWTDDYGIDFEFTSVIKNISNSEIILQNLSVYNDKIQFETDNLFSIIPDMERTLTAKVNIGNTSGNVYLRPKLTYLVNGNALSRTTNLTLYASTVPIGILIDLLKEEKML